MTRGVDRKEARELLSAQGPEALDLLARAGKARYEERGTEVLPCSVVNAKSGLCNQDCAFCAQSSRSKATIDRYPLRAHAELVAEARDLARQGAVRVGIVTSGRAVTNDRELSEIGEAIHTLADEGVAWPCASLGLLGRDSLTRLKAAGLTRYHHNLETAESFFPKICSSRNYRASIDAIEAAKAVGLSTCCGGLLGMGESLDQRIELLWAIRELQVDSVPLNFLHPIQGTPLESQRQLTPMDCLKLVAVARLVMPRVEVRVCGGREHNLRDLQSWVLLAGAEGIMVGGYLTTSGRRIADDMQMIVDAGLTKAPGPS